MVKYKLKDKIPTSTKISLIFSGIGLFMILLGYGTEIGGWLLDSGVVLFLLGLVVATTIILVKWNKKIKEM